MGKSSNLAANWLFFLFEHGVGQLEIPKKQLPTEIRALNNLMRDCPIRLLRLTAYTEQLLCFGAYGAGGSASTAPDPQSKSILPLRAR